MPRAGLTGQRVLAEAASLADEVGYERLSLAALAARCRVASPSLYKHVAGLEAIRSGVAVRALDELAQTLRAATAGLARGEALHAMAAAYRGYAHRHPGRYAATLRAPRPADAAHVQASAAVLAIVFRVLADYGLTGDDAVDATRALRAALHGFVALEASGGFGMPRDVDRSFGRLVAGLDATLAQWASGASMADVPGGRDPVSPSVVKEGEHDPPPPIAARPAGRRPSAAQSLTREGRRERNRTSSAPPGVFGTEEPKRRRRRVVDAEAFRPDRPPQVASESC